MWNWLGTAPPPPVPEEVLASAEGSKEEGDNSDEPLHVPTVQNVKEVASQWGSYLYGFANVAASTATKLKDTAATKLDNTILGEFNRENEKFKQEKETRRIGDGVPPWTGYIEEAAMKRQILALSTDERNFLRSPPSGVDFVFDIEHFMPVAMATLVEDDNLAQMRFTLVPKRIKEELFWRNFFYRVSLVKQSTQLSSMTDSSQEFKPSPYTSSTESLNKTAESPVETPEVDAVKQQEETIGDVLVDISPETEGVTEVVADDVNEFVSDSFQVDGDLSEEERNQMMAMASEDPLPAEKIEITDAVIDDVIDDVTDDVDWDLDKELQDEIDSFELVNENDESENEEQWEKEIEDLIELDSTETA